MDIKLLRSFSVLASVGHYGRAAKQLNMTQSTLSKQIRALEEDIGGFLIERGRHGANLTALGTMLLKEAEALLRHNDEIEAKMRSANDGLAGHLDVAFGISTLRKAPGLITSFRQDVPNCQITLNDMASAEQHQRLLARRLDVGFCRAPENAEELEFLPLFVEHLALIAPQDIEMPSENRVEELNRLGFVMLSSTRGPGLDRQINHWCQSAKVVPRVIQQADDVLTVHAVVAAGLGVAFFPWHGVQALAGPVRRLKLDGAAATWPMGLCWRKRESSPLLLRFIDHVRHTCPTDLG